MVKFLETAWTSDQSLACSNINKNKLETDIWGLSSLFKNKYKCKNFILLVNKRYKPITSWTVNGWMDTQLCKLGDLDQTLSGSGFWVALFSTLMLTKLLILLVLLQIITNITKRITFFKCLRSTELNCNVIYPRVYDKTATDH